MDIIEEVKALNKKAVEMNEQRNKALWEKNSAEKALASALAEYNEKYNTNLTVEDVPSEYEKVEAEVKLQAERVKKQIHCIETGEVYEDSSEGVVKVESQVDTDVKDVKADTDVRDVKADTDVKDVKADTDVKDVKADTDVKDVKADTDVKVDVTPKVEEKPKPTFTSGGFDFSKYI